MKSFPACSGVQTMRIAIRTSLLLVLSLAWILHCCAEQHKQQQLPSAMVVGTVYCDTCFHHQFSKASRFLSGALVSVECGESRKPSFRKVVKTDRHGVFRARLPLKLSRYLKPMEACSAKIITINDPSCSVAASATSSALNLKSTSKNLHVFSAGFFAFRPLNLPVLCHSKPSFASEKLQPAFFFPSPPIPLIPSPPTFGGIPMPPNPFQPPSLLPPNPFQPPSLLPPNPFQPPSLLPPNPFQPPPSVFPPLPFQPSPPPFINIPTLPFLNPPPPPPVFPFPPLFPGIPPAFDSKKTSP